MNRFLDIATEIAEHKSKFSLLLAQASSYAAALAVPTPSLGVLKARINQYFNASNHTYTTKTGTAIQARPVFTYGKNVRPGNSLDQLKKQFKAVLDKRTYGSLKFKIAKTMYGRSKPSDIQQITQALIDAGVPLTSEDPEGIRALQRRFGIGIDCAGYVQLAFFYSIHGHDNDSSSKRTALGLHQKRGYERLYNLKNRHFRKINSLAAVQTGDLMILHPRPGVRDRAIHTLMVADKTQTGDIHEFTVDASWGSDAYGPEAEGIARRKLFFNEKTKEWWDIQPNPKEPDYGKPVNKNTVGPYLGHPLKGIYRKK